MSKKSKKRKKSKMNSYIFYMNGGYTVKKSAINPLLAEQALTQDEQTKGYRGVSVDNTDEYILKDGVWHPNEKYYPTIKCASNVYGNFCFPEELCFASGTKIPAVDKDRAKELLPNLEGLNLDVLGDAFLAMFFSPKALFVIEEWEYLHNCNKVDYVFVPLKIYMVMHYNKITHKASPFRIPYLLPHGNKIANHLRYKF